jgi:hypothetical protein
MNGLRFVLLFVALAGLLWNVANVLEARRYLRRVRTRNQPWLAVRIRFINQPLTTKHASKVQPCQILKFSTRK